MKYEIFLVRHSLTSGNEQGRYIGGRTDEPLCEKGVELVLLEKDRLFNSFSKFLTDPSLMIFASPMKRCLMTAKLLFPSKPVIPIEGFREIDFGEFENQNYENLKNNPLYQKWIDSGGNLPFPKGEDKAGFINRSYAAFFDLLKTVSARPYPSKATNKPLFITTSASPVEIKRLAIVAHGGTIMAIMNRLTGEDYYNFQVKNMKGYKVNFDMEGTSINDLSYDCL